jgi:DNA-3-methyladenine glycosylase II
MTDEEVIIELSKIKGVGKWTAEIILIFTLNREDVFSLGDAGLKRAIKNLYGITDGKKILKLSETWKPNRSYACWYLWRSLNNDPQS